MRIEQQETGSVMLLTVMDKRIDARVAPEFKRFMNEIVEGGQHWIALDIENVEFIDSSGLGAIVTALKSVGRRGDLAISGARQPVNDLFRLTRMDKVFRMFATNDEAVAALQH
ncbi:MAG TPA: STAS domain-containing protein [Thermoanaerobaculia bacterium]|nr:STAS domain-containing protein [Thermoanaerobaculia bacterium]